MKPIMALLDFVLVTMHLNMCLQHRRIWKWVHDLTEHKSLDTIKYVPTEPWNLVDTIVVYGTVEFVLFFSNF